MTMKSNIIYKDYIGTNTGNIYISIDGINTVAEIKSRLRNAMDGVSEVQTTQVKGLSNEEYKNASILLYMLKAKTWRPEENKQYKFSLIDGNQDGIHDIGNGKLH